MRMLTAFVVLLAFVTTGCNRKSTDQNGFTANVHVATPFAGNKNGKLYLKKEHLRVDLGPMTDVYDISQKKGWRMFPDSKQYMNIGWKDVSTYLPTMVDGSPCLNADQPSACKMVNRQVVDGRSTTKWQTLNQRGEQVYLWTDDQLGIAVRWQIENVTYEATDIRGADIADTFFVLPSSYTELSQQSSPAPGISR